MLAYVTVTKHAQQRNSAVSLLLLSVHTAFFINMLLVVPLAHPPTSATQHNLLIYARHTMLCICLVYYTIVTSYGLELYSTVQLAEKSWTVKWNCYPGMERKRKVASIILYTRVCVCVCQNYSSGERLVIELSASLTSTGTPSHRYYNRWWGSQRSGDPTTSAATE